MFVRESEEIDKETNDGDEGDRDSIDQSMDEKSSLVFDKSIKQSISQMMNDEPSTRKGRTLTNADLMAYSSHFKSIRKGTSIDSISKSFFTS